MTKKKNKYLIKKNFQKYSKIIYFQSQNYKIRKFEKFKNLNKMIFSQKQVLVINKFCENLYKNLSLSFLSLSIKNITYLI